MCHKQLHTLWNYKGHVAQHNSVLKENALLATQHSNTENPLYATNARSLQSTAAQMRRKINAMSVRCNFLGKTAEKNTSEQYMIKTYVS